MQKISGILPSTRRVTNVDMRDSSPIRPGQPAFGRRVGRSGRPEGIPKGQGGFGTDASITSIADKTERHKAIIEKVSNGFFMKDSAPTQPLAPLNYEMSSEVALSGQGVGDAESFSDVDWTSEASTISATPAFAPAPADPGLEAQAEDLDVPQRGHHLNVTA